VKKKIDGLVYFLLKNGAHVYLINKFRKTPLMLAIQNGYIGDIGLLMERPHTNFNNSYIMKACPDDETKEFVLQRARIHICKRLRPQLKQDFGAVANDKRCYISFETGVIAPSNKNTDFLFKNWLKKNYPENK